MSMLIVTFLMPFYLQNVLGYSPFSVALVSLPFAIALNIMAVPSGWVYDRFGSRMPCSVAMLLGALLLLSYLGLSETSTAWDILPRLALGGIVFGLFVTPNVSAMLGAVPSRFYSLTTGLEQTTRNLGHAVGVVISSGVASFILGSTVNPGPETYVAVVHGASIVSGVLMGSGVILSLMRQDSGRPRTAQRAAEAPEGATSAASPA